MFYLKYIKYQRRIVLQLLSLQHTFQHNSSVLLRNSEGMNRARRGFQNWISPSTLFSPHERRVFSPCLNWNASQGRCAWSPTPGVERNQTRKRFARQRYAVKVTLVYLIRRYRINHSNVWPCLGISPRVICSYTRKISGFAVFIRPFYGCSACNGTKYAA